MTTTVAPTDTDVPTDAEVAAHAVLELVATHPGQFGRLRSARVVGGYALRLDDPNLVTSVAPFSSLVLHWPLREVVNLIDALLAGGLLAQTTGQRPTLVLTRSGHRALDALEQERPSLAQSSTPASRIQHP